MDVINIINIQRKDIPLHYREEFSGSALFRTTKLEENEINMEFVVERTPYGTKEVEIIFPVAPNFSIIPAIKSLKEYILKLEKEGKLR